jgi:hypothetical protein
MKTIFWAGTGWITGSRFADGEAPDEQDYNYEGTERIG